MDKFHVTYMDGDLMDYVDFSSLMRVFHFLKENKISFYFIEKEDDGVNPSNLVLIDKDYVNKIEEENKKLKVTKMKEDLENISGCARLAEALQEENKKLKQELDFITKMGDNHIDWYQKEIIELKEEIKGLRERHESHLKLVEENEKLKTQMGIYIKGYNEADVLRLENEKLKELTRNVGYAKEDVEKWVNEYINEHRNKTEK